MKLVTIKQMSERLARGGRLIGLDVGTRNVGVAISDTLCRLASPHSVLHRKNSMTLQNVDSLDILVQNHAVVGFTIGYPFEMGGNRSNQELMVKSLVSELEMSGKFSDLCYMYWDERLTSASRSFGTKSAVFDNSYLRKSSQREIYKAVSTMLLSLNIAGVKRKQLIDKMAAVSILQGCLDNLQTYALNPSGVPSTE